MDDEAEYSFVGVIQKELLNGMADADAPFLTAVSKHVAYEAKRMLDSYVECDYLDELMDIHDERHALVLSCLAELFRNVLLDFFDVSKLRDVKFIYDRPQGRSLPK